MPDDDQKGRLSLGMYWGLYRHWQLRLVTENLITVTEMNQNLLNTWRIILSLLPPEARTEVIFPDEATTKLEGVYVDALGAGAEAVLPDYDEVTAPMPTYSRYGTQGTAWLDWVITQRKAYLDEVYRIKTEAVERRDITKRKIAEYSQKLTEWATERETIRATWAHRAAFQKGQAMLGAFKGEAAVTGEMPPMPSPVEAFERRFEAMSPAMRQYFERRAPDLLSQFEEEYPNARAAWWEALYTPAPPEPWEEIPALEEQLGKMRQMAQEYHLETGALSPEEIEARWWTMPWQLGRAAVSAIPNIEAQIAEAKAARETYMTSGQYEYDLAQLELPRAEPARDPLEAWLKEYPFMQEYLKLPRRQRGEYPSRYAPPARWRV